MAGIYIHIPFCKQACTYCNFHFSTSLKQKDKLVDAIIAEIGLTDKSHSGKDIETIYFGGGTPSILSADELRLILETVYKEFNISDNAEITLEANPDDISYASLLQWKKSGINRFSLGVQSFSEDELRWMNRAHHAAESLNSIDMIQQAGFTNFSVDLIYGSPLSGNEQLQNNLEIISKKNIPHVSCYALTVEPKTVLDKMISLQRSLPVDPDKQSEQFLFLMKWMKQHGYEHYEISNYAKPGMRSRHNSSYWEGTPYYGFGPSAHSYDGKNRRRWNIANNALYMEAIAKKMIPFEEEELSDTQQLNEYIMTSLRTTEGLSLKKVSAEFGSDKTSEIKKQSIPFIHAKKIKEENENLMLTDEGKLFADGIAAGLFF